MRVQSCPSCGARYNVERAPPGSTFECRRCGHRITVEAAEAPPKRFAWGLLVAGVLALLTALLWANPEYGVGTDEWPWEVVEGGAPPSVKALVVLWVLAGAWALASSLGVAVRVRSVLTVALAGAILMVSAADSFFDAGDLQIAYGATIGLGLVALTAGLLTHDRPGRERVGRTLAFAGGLVLVAHFTLVFEGGATRVEGMVGAVGDWFGGTAPVDPWRAVFPQWALLIAGVVGLVAGLCARGCWLRWTGIALAAVFLALATAADVKEGGLGEDAAAGIATYAFDGIVSSGLALWWLGAAGVADVVRAGRRTR